MAANRNIVTLCAATMMLMISGIGCEIAPLETTGQPRGEILKSPEVPPIPPPKAEAVKVPAGYQVEVVASGLTYPIAVEPLADGSLYVAESGYVYGDPAAVPKLLHFSPDGALKVVTTNLKGPVTDLLWHQNQLYISHRGKISVLEGNRVRDLITDLPSLGDHHNNQLSVGPDGYLYFGQGTATNSGVVGVDNFMMGWLPLFPEFHDIPPKDIQLNNTEFMSMNPFVMTVAEKPPMAGTYPFSPFNKEREGSLVSGATKASGTILRFRPEDPSTLEVYAWGLRNPYGVQWGRDGRLYVAENGFDDRGSRPIANALDNLWVIEQDAWYGWPDYASGIPVTDAQFNPPEKEGPEFLMKNHPPVGKPLVTRPEHVAVTQLAVSPPDGRFGAPGHLFLAEFGPMTPMTGIAAEKRGWDVVRINPETREVDVFFHAKEGYEGPEHFEYFATAGPRHPVGLAFAPDGSALYVADMGAMAILPTVAPTLMPMPETGVIWRVSRTGTRNLRPPANLNVQPAVASPDGSGL